MKKVELQHDPSTPCLQGTLENPVLVLVGVSQFALLAPSLDLRW